MSHFLEFGVIIMKMTIGEIVKATGARLESGKKDVSNIPVTGVNFDSRNLKEGSLFVPLKGQHDGHDYIKSAEENGAVATFLGKDHVDSLPISIPALIVDDPLKSFQNLSRYYLTKINPRVVAITGSNGKTTTKDMIASILATTFNVTKTHDNFNNEIGVPYTILQMEPNTEFLVVEMGMDRFGQLDFLSKLVNPDLAVITMIGEAHIEFFGTIDRSADAKMESTHGLSEDGSFVYNGDEPLLISRSKNLQQRKFTCGRTKENDIYPVQVSDGKYQTEFKVNKWPKQEFTIPMLGDYNVNNALAAIEVGDLFKIPVMQIVKALKNVNLTENRAEWIKGKNQVAILSDVYNSNPTAAKQVLKAFQSVSVKGKRYVVLGDMLELGSHSKEMHQSLASHIDPKKVDSVFLVGTDIKVLADSLKSKFANNKIHYYLASELDLLAKDLNGVLGTNDAVMLKASHGIHLEKVLVKLVSTQSADSVD